MRILHLSDIHVWRFEFNPFRLVGKRSVGMLELLTGRAKKFRLERLDAVVSYAESLGPDHVLITGDLTTTALGSEFRAARLALEPLLKDPSRATVIPGNHDRYTPGSVRSRKFEETFGEFMPRLQFPWLRPLDDETAILGLDPTRSHISATGRIPEPQLTEAKRIAADSLSQYRRKIIACHYPLAAPPPYEGQLAQKRMKNADSVAEWLRGIGPHVYCCGHVHAAWAFTPPGMPNAMCLNSGRRCSATRPASTCRGSWKSSSTGPG